MSPPQLKFYKYWKSQIRSGVALDVGESISYVFCYCYEILSSDDFDLICEEMTALAKAYENSEKICFYCRCWGNDALVGRGTLNER